MDHIDNYGRAYISIRLVLGFNSISFTFGIIHLVGEPYCSWLSIMFIEVSFSLSESPPLNKIINISYNFLFLFF